MILKCLKQYPEHRRCSIKISTPHPRPRAGHTPSVDLGPNSAQRSALRPPDPSPSKASLAGLSEADDNPTPILGKCTQAHSLQFQGAAPQGWCEQQLGHWALGTGLPMCFAVKTHDCPLRQDLFPTPPWGEAGWGPREQNGDSSSGRLSLQLEALMTRLTASEGGAS